MKTIKIEIPKGFEIDAFDKSSGEIKFKPTPKPVTERIQDFEDVLRENGITPADFESQCDGLSPDEIGYKKEKLIVSAYNEGKLPDWSDGTPKYYPIFRMPSPSGVGFSSHDFARWNASSIVGARLVFVGQNAKAHVLDAVKKFLPEYEQSRTA